MHGSINWAYCESCQELHVANLAQMREAYDQDTLGFPVIAICKGCGGQRRPMIVPPMSFKFVQFPPLLVLWERAQRVLNGARLIVAVGYSFAEADTYITKMTIKAMVQDPARKLVVIDPKRSVAESLVRQLSAAIDGFDPTRVLCSRESCEIIVPKLLESWVSPPQPDMSSNGSNAESEKPLPVE
jgi:NAD-dependent SIR2 family protein deacetylase